MSGFQLGFSYHVSDIGFYLDLPYDVYDGVRVDPVARALCQSIADTYGLPLVTFNGSFLPEEPSKLELLLNNKKCKDYYKIYQTLRECPKTTQEICEVIGKSQPTISIKLNRMVDDGLVVKLKKRWAMKPELLFILGLIEESVLGD